MDDSVEPLERRRLWRLLLLVLALIAYGSLYPFSFRPIHTAILAWVWDPGLPGIRDAIVNLVVYFPVGFLTYYVGPKSPRHRILAATLVSFALSAMMECLQAFDQGRVSSVLDLLLNTASGTVGASTASLLPSLITPPLAVLILAIVARTYPFFPHLHPHVSSFHWDQAMYAAVDWLAVRSALAFFLQRTRVTRELALLQLTIPLRIFILDQATSFSDIAGTLLTLALSYVWLDRTTLLPRQLAPVMLLTIIARELAPFHFSAAPQEFHWIPFETFLGGSPAGAVVFLTKLLLYASALWLLAPESRHIWRYGSALSFLLLILEWTQRYLPGRTPDISDSLLVLIAATALSSCGTDDRFLSSVAPTS